jgi:hypothetical protein
MIFLSSMGLTKSRCDVPSGTTQRHDCPYQKHLGGFFLQIVPPLSLHLVPIQALDKNLNVNE